MLSEEYTIDTPENVTFGYDVAGIGSRFIGALIDSTILVALLILLNIAIALLLTTAAGDGGPKAVETEADPGWLVGAIIAVYALLNFSIIWGYYIAFELLWDGRTPGKRAAGTRVVKMDGSPAGFIETAIRNLVRIVDFLPFAYAIGLITMFFNRRARRLGDFAAGTLVIKHRGDIKLETLGAPPTTVRPLSLPVATNTVPAVAPIANIRRLTGADYQIIHETLVRGQQGMIGDDIMRRLAAAIATKLQEPTVFPTAYAARTFLVSVMDAYRVAGSARANSTSGREPLSYRCGYKPHADGSVRYSRTYDA